MTAGLQHEALTLLRRLTGDPASSFREDQLEVIRRLVADRERVLLVQRTGWGKSAVYFIATRMLRDRGGGPTLLVSPLLALMRNQIEAAERMGVRATTINSANRTEWDVVEEQLRADSVDVLLISPERLANPTFRRDLLPEIGRRSGLLVIDEAHCISDWGHDFRPDYRRLVRVLDLLPAGVPVLCCTATANNRVVTDITRQLGAGLAPIRGPLGRSGLRLRVLDLPLPAQRLAWLAETLPILDGTGIIYCLTIADTERVAGWLRSQGIDAIAYSGDTNPALRPGIEQRLLDNEVKVVVATSALGMGFDKPDLAFVIHYQSPGSPIAYYQQVGRAGRGLAQSDGVLLCGAEDSTVQDFFIRSAFPPADLAEKVVALLEEQAQPVSAVALLEAVNMRPGQLDLLLKTLEVEGAIEREGNRWQRTLGPWAFDHERVASVTALRRAEQAQMREYAQTQQCRMHLLRQSLDDELAEPCGLCDNCRGEGPGPELLPAVVQAAVEYLRGAERTVEPRKQWPDRTRIPAHHQVQSGRALSVWGDGGWGSLVRSGRISEGCFDEQLISAAADLITRRWQPHPAPTWVTFVPSRHDPDPVADLARRLAAMLDLPCEDVVVNGRHRPPQHEWHNSVQQWANVRHAFAVGVAVPSGPVLLVDDVVDSRWTLTAVGRLLLMAGAGPVFPFVLADTAGRAPV
ncbi:MAG: RecQ family ATP-dependent DNA helicase [Acidimicrobiales bacterium]